MNQAHHQYKRGCAAHISKSSGFGTQGHYPETLPSG